MLVAKSLLMIWGLSFVCSPHELVAQRVEIILVIFPYDMYPVWGFAKGDGAVFAQALASAVNGEEETVVPAVDFHFDGTLVVEDKRACIETMCGNRGDAQTA